ncbi:DUF6252 family protein [Segetibacter aerophilus]|nr:DUF6252 family protein [Segetibacter aerophilus]
MKYLLSSLIIIAFFLNSCEKDQNRKLLGGYFKYSINGKETIINDEVGINSNVFDCTFKGDSVLTINVSKIYEGAGFIVKSDSIKDGTYVLDNANKAYYTNPLDQKRYYTNDKFKGTLNIKKGTFEAKELLYTLEGTFNFQAVDTVTGKNFNVVNGSFLMERTTFH